VLFGGFTRGYRNQRLIPPRETWPYGSQPVFL
jgi:hypothetical protein